MNVNDIGCSYRLEQPVEVHLGHDDVLATGEGCFYVHDPFAGVREGLYLFNHDPAYNFVPGIMAIEAGVTFDTFERPQRVPIKDADYVVTYSTEDYTWLYQTPYEFRQYMAAGHQIPVRRVCSLFAEPDTRFWELDWKEQQRIRKARGDFNGNDFE